MRSSFSLIKLPNGAYFLWSINDGVAPQVLLFAQKGIRSKGKTVIVPYRLTGYMGARGIKDFLINKGFNNIDRLFLCYDGSNDIRSGNIDGVKKEYGVAFRDITKRVLVYDVSQWIRDNNIKGYQIDWYANVVQKMIEDKRFILGQMNDRWSLVGYKEKVTQLQSTLEKREEELKNLKTVDEVKSTSIKNIARMKWIEKIESAPNNSLRILTKPMACTFVENIGHYMPIEYIQRYDMLYRIMKYQALGKYFIIQPDYYLIDANFGIKADSNQRYKPTHVRNVMMRNTYFRGQACHIGDGQACVGELASAISNARKNGLDMLLMSFEAYLRSINLPDAAGQRFFCLPMGDADGNVEVWPYVEDMMKKENVSFGDKPRNLETYEWILSNTKLSRYAENFGKTFDGSCTGWGTSQGNMNMEKCLNLIKEREPEVYEIIMKRKEEGAVI